MHEHQIPLARKDRLIIQEMPEELLVYDLDSNEAHCLNRAAATVWRHCDGILSVEQLAQTASTELGTPVDTQTVWHALDQLGKYRLLQENVTLPAHLAGMSRRDFMRKASITAAAVAVPIVISIAAPTAAHAATSCLPTGAACGTGAQCCSGMCTGGFCA